VNPYDKRGMALALQRALHMSLDERRQRHRQMLDALRANDIHHWYGTFCRDLDSVGSAPHETKLSVHLGSASPAERGWWERAKGRLFNSKAS
jgi:trehalose 6-phosphate synthase